MPNGHMNSKLEHIIMKHKKLNLCVFYGRQAAQKISFTPNVVEIIKKIQANNRLYCTVDDGKFHHISRTSKNLHIVKCKNLSKIGINCE